MKLFIDSANLLDIEDALKRNFISGITTNPTLISKESNVNYIKHIFDIIDLLASYNRKDISLSVEVTSSDPTEINKQIQEFSEITRFYNQLYIKIPIGWSYLPLIRTIHGFGGKVNCTACMSVNQAIVAANAGADFVSLFWGRIKDSGADPFGVVQQTHKLFKEWNSHSQIIVGSIRHPDDVWLACVAGADIVTVPPKFLIEMCRHPKTDEVVTQFLNDFTQRHTN